MSFDPVMPPYNSSDPAATFLSSSCLDFLLIELVPLAHRITHERDTALLSSGNPPTDIASTSHAVSSSAAGVVAGTGPRKIDDEEELDAVHYRLEMLGYRVGQGLVERFGSFEGNAARILLIPVRAGFQETGHDSTTRWTSSSSYARTCGP